MSGRVRLWLVAASAIAVVASAAFLPGAGFGSPGAAVRGDQAFPAGLAEAIHSRFGTGALRSSSAALSIPQPDLGFSVALSADGTTALVGASGVNNGKGAAYIFHVSDAGSWASTGTPIATLTKLAPVSGEFFGDHVALSADGTTAFVTAPLVQGGGALGAIYVFHVSAEDAWASTSTPMAILRATDDLVGLTIGASSDGTTVVAAAPFHNNQYGGAYVFHASSESAWTSTSTPTATLTNADEGSDDIFVGYYVAISGDGATALVSDDDNVGGGDAYVYHVSDEGSWTSSSTPTAILSDASSVDGDFLSHNLALSGDGTVALLGAAGVNYRAGAVDVYHVSDASSWASTSTPTATLTNAGGAAYAYFGDTLTVSTDGTTALIGADGMNAGRGAAYIFRVADEGSWASSSTPTATLTNSGSHVHDYLGYGLAVSADGASALAGATGVRFETGATDVFHASDPSSWASTSTPNAILTVSALNACVVPKLKGLRVLAAKAALKARSCRLGTVRRVVHRAGRRGRVFFQSRPTGSRSPVGSKVNVKIKK